MKSGFFQLKFLLMAGLRDAVLPWFRGPDAASGYTGSETDLQLALHTLSSLSCSILVISVNLSLLLPSSLSCSLSSNEALSPLDQLLL